MAVRIKHIDKTCLQEKPLLAVIKKHLRSEKDLDIVFDRRLRDCMGWYWYDETRRTHLIKVSPVVHEYHDFDVRKPLDNESRKYKFVSTILHELRHIQQKEELGKSYYNKNYCKNKNLTSAFPAYFYAEAELDARAYELQNISEAMEIYKSLEE